MTTQVPPESEDLHSHYCFRVTQNPESARERQSRRSVRKVRPEDPSRMPNQDPKPIVTTLGNLRSPCRPSLGSNLGLAKWGLCYPVPLVVKEMFELYRKQMLGELHSLAKQ